MFKWLTSKPFWGDAIERAVKTGAQFFLFYLIGSDTIPTGALNVFEGGFDLLDAGQVTASGIVLSLLTSILAAGARQSESPNLATTASGASLK